MKIESCRTCGKELEVKKKCDICSQANQFFCHNCGYEGEEQIHFQCIMMSFDIALLNA
ncbi:MAG: hypothetical protein IIC67_01420 [Thaumarchaeota archaeon]|nr:hypothetical protein [Nitrososphaerota archaeon]